MPRLRAGLALVLALIAVSGAVSLAQRFGVAEGAGAGIRVPPEDFNDGRFTVCKWMFRSNRSEPSGIGWSTDYPFGEINLLIRLSELTKIPVSRDKRGDVNYWVVRLTDDQLFECPMLIGSDVGTVALSDAEVQRLREYLLKGGFLWVDDFWGTPAWDQWSDQIARVLPEFPIVDTTPADPIRQALFTITEVKQVPSIFSWAGPGSDPRERGTDSPHADFRVIADAHGRVMVAMTHNTDIGDSMEREGDDPQYFAEFSRGRLRVGDEHRAVCVDALITVAEGAPEGKPTDQDAMYPARARAFAPRFRTSTLIWCQRPSRFSGAT